MLAADYAISRIRRDLTLGAFVRFLLLGAALACLLVGPFVSTGALSGFALVMIGVIWTSRPNDAVPRIRWSVPRTRRRTRRS